MKSSLLQVIVLAGLATAQLQKLPKCASTCYAQAISASTCDITDAACMCTTGMKHILAVAVPCICKSTCTSEELLQAEKASNGICESAVPDYHPITMGAEACAAAANPSASSYSTPAPNSAETTPPTGYGGSASSPTTVAPVAAPSGGLPGAGGYGGGNQTNATGTVGGSPQPPSYTGAAVRMASWVSEAGLLGLAVWAAFM